MTEEQTQGRVNKSTDNNIVISPKIENNTQKISFLTNICVSGCKGYSSSFGVEEIV